MNTHNKGSETHKYISTKIDLNLINSIIVKKNVIQLQNE